MKKLARLLEAVHELRPSIKRNIFRLGYEKNFEGWSAANDAFVFAFPSAGEAQKFVSLVGGIATGAIGGHRVLFNPDK